MTDKKVSLIAISKGERTLRILGFSGKNGFLIRFKKNYLNI